MNTARVTPQDRFDERYYSKWYGGDIETRQYIADKAARFVLSYVEHMDARVGTVLDLGCGLGLWKKALLRQLEDPGVARVKEN